MMQNLPTCKTCLLLLSFLWFAQFHQG